MTDTYDRSLNSIYDSLYQAMDARKRAELQAAVLESARDSFETLLDEYERIPYNEHRFQSFIRAAFLKAMALVGEEPEASEWMRYLYDLWNDRAPGAGRNDGGGLPGPAISMPAATRSSRCPVCLADTRFSFDAPAGPQFTADTQIFFCLPASCCLCILQHIVFICLL